MSHRSGHSSGVLRLHLAVAFGLGLGAPAAWGAGAIVDCVDGASPARLIEPGRGPTGTIGAACDEDRQRNGRCEFWVSASATPTSAARIIRGRVRVGHRKRLRTVRPIVVRCLAEPAAPPPVVTCADGVGPPETDADPACDVDQACQGACTFAFHCPPCCGCLAACFSAPTYRVTVPVGEEIALPACLGSRETTEPRLVLSCLPTPADVLCSATTTTTILLPGQCLTDADCVDWMPPCNVCRHGSCTGPMHVNPDGSVSGVVCPTPTTLPAP